MYENNLLTFIIWFVAAAKSQNSKPTSKATTPSISSSPSTKSTNTNVSQLSKDVTNKLKVSSAANSVSSSRPSTPQIKESNKLIPRKEIIEEIKRKEKKNISLCVVGHVDAGKSTILGRLLVELGEMSKKDHDKNARQSDKEGKSSFAYAWAMDDLQEERERGVTLDYALTSLKLSKDKALNIVDTPGHAHLVHNMISGASQADAALLIIDARPGEFEAGFSERGQTREHALLVRSLGVRDLGIVINKIDSVDYSQQRYEEIVNALKPFLITCGFNKDRIKFVPCAAMTGENVTARSNNTLKNWYNGKTVAEILSKWK